MLPLRSEVYTDVQVKHLPPGKYTVEKNTDLSYEVIKIYGVHRITIHPDHHT